MIDVFKQYISQKIVILIGYFNFINLSIDFKFYLNNHLYLFRIIGLHSQNKSFEPFIEDQKCPIDTILNFYPMWLSLTAHSDPSPLNVFADSSISRWFGEMREARPSSVPWEILTHTSSPASTRRQSVRNWRRNRGGSVMCSLSCVF